LALEENSMDQEDLDPEAKIPGKQDAPPIHWVSAVLPGVLPFDDRTYWGDDFMSLAVEASLSGYIRNKLETGAYRLSDKVLRPLLFYAVFPRDRHRPFMEPSNPSTTRLLLEYGADPNQTVTLQVGVIRSVWQLALQWAFNSKVIQRDCYWGKSTSGRNWARNADLLVEHGADVNTWLWIRTYKGRHTYSSLYVIIDLLRGNSEARDHLALKIRDYGGRLYNGEKAYITQQYSLDDEGHQAIEFRDPAEEFASVSMEINLGGPFVAVETRQAVQEYANKLVKLLEQLPESEPPIRPESERD